MPHSPDCDRPPPVILFLHGGGEAGTDGWKPTTVGIGPAIRSRESTFPFLVVFPQVCDRIPATHGSWLAGQPDSNRALAILDEAIHEFGADSERVFLTGISVGATGVWSLAASVPGRWTAIAPACGIGPTTKAADLANVPCWAFHGDKDDVVSIDHSRRMLDAMREAGGRPRFTEYPGVGHNCWDRAYSSGELFDWFLTLPPKRHDQNK